MGKKKAGSKQGKKGNEASRWKSLWAGGALTAAAMLVAAIVLDSIRWDRKLELWLHGTGAELRAIPYTTYEFVVNFRLINVNIPSPNAGVRVPGLVRIANLSGEDKKEEMLKDCELVAKKSGPVGNYFNVKFGQANTRSVHLGLWAASDQRVELAVRDLDKVRRLAIGVPPGRWKFDVSRSDEFGLEVQNASLTCERKRVSEIGGLNTEILRIRSASSLLLVESEDAEKQTLTFVYEGLRGVAEKKELAQPRPADGEITFGEESGAFSETVFPSVTRGFVRISGQEPVELEEMADLYHRVEIRGRVTVSKVEFSEARIIVSALGAGKEVYVDGSNRVESMLAWVRRKVPWFLGGK